MTQVARGACGHTHTQASGQGQGAQACCKGEAATAQVGAPGGESDECVYVALDLGCTHLQQGCRDHGHAPGPFAGLTMEIRVGNVSRESHHPTEAQVHPSPSGNSLGQPSAWIRQWCSWCTSCSVVLWWWWWWWCVVGGSEAAVPCGSRSHDGWSGRRTWGDPGLASSMGMGTGTGQNCQTCVWAVIPVQAQESCGSVSSKEDWGWAVGDGVPDAWVVHQSLQGPDISNVPWHYLTFHGYVCITHVRQVCTKSFLCIRDMYSVDKSHNPLWIICIASERRAAGAVPFILACITDSWLLDNTTKWPQVHVSGELEEAFGMAATAQISSAQSCGWVSSTQRADQQTIIFLSLHSMS